MSALSGSTFGDADARDTQALLRTAFDSLACTLLLLRIEDPATARAWLRLQLDNVACVSQVGHDKPPVQRTLQIALTAEGLRALGMRDILKQFSAEFSTSLVDDPNRLRRLGDIADNAPANWHWGVGEREPHVLLMLFASWEQIAAFSTQVQGNALASGLSVLEILAAGDMDGSEPFGFRDGISQPSLDWDGSLEPDSDADMGYRNRIALGEFLLGYRNEYGQYTERPLLAATESGARHLPIAEDRPDCHDLGRNGTFLVLRQLQQDVNGFWRWVYREAGGDAAAATALAEAMIGRHVSGEPFAGLGKRGIDGVEPAPDGQPRNDFSYARDRAGQVCPVGAHIRRANPRTGDYPEGITGFGQKLLTLLGLNGTAEDDHIASARFHRLLRRGRKYGNALVPADAARATDAGTEAGLYFICLNANLARQFEFIQGAWLASGKFAGMSNEQDPLLGNRQPFPGDQPTDRFSQPQASGPCRIALQLPQFVRLRGSGYFLLPGLAALKWLLADR